MIEDHDLQIIQQQLPCPLSDFPCKYLGLPLFFLEHAGELHIIILRRMKKSKIDHYRPLKERRIQS
jgi:hypothetical protein